jgi:stage II sporulation protein D
MRIRGAVIASAAALCVAVGAAVSALSVTDKPYAVSCGLSTGSATLGEIKRYKTTLSNGELSDLEEYLIGVVAAEMPAAYSSEALKAQAVASRTYAIRAVEADSSVKLTDLGQAYISSDEMKVRWGDSYDKWYDKIRRAVEDTRGIIVVYADEPILAAFCASSDGTTEDCGNVWGSELPYLVSVDSHWDSTSEDFEKVKGFTEDELKSKLGGIPEITEKTQAGYVKSVLAGGNELSGIEVRERLGLKSAAFDVVRTDVGCDIVTRGYGHGVGMSQTGAGKMAEEGADFQEILEHYYTGAEIARLK